MRLTLGSRSFDLTTRALVMGVAGVPAGGADLVELDHPSGLSSVPVCVAVSDEAGVARALVAGASLVRMAEPTTAGLARCAAAGAAVMVPPDAGGRAAGAGLPPDRVVPDTLLLDVTAEACPSAATAAGVIRGARIVRTADVRGARRVCDVLAAVMEAD